MNIKSRTKCNYTLEGIVDGMSSKLLGQHQMATILLCWNLSFWGHSLRSNDRAALSVTMRKSEGKITRARIFSMKYNCHVQFLFSLFRFIWHRIHFLRQDMTALNEKHSHSSEQVYTLNRVYFVAFCVCIFFSSYFELWKEENYPL